MEKTSLSLPVALMSILVLGVSAGCAPVTTRSQAPALANLRARPTYRGLVVDRMPDGRSALVVGGGPVATSPAGAVIQIDEKAAAAIEPLDVDRFVVRGSTDRSAPPLGEVEATWRDGMLRLTLRSADGAALSTSRFRRTGSSATPGVLVYTMRSPWAMAAFPGVYRAEVRDDRGAAIGWLSVHILPYEGLPRDYSGDLPRSLDGSLTAGAVALLDAKIDEIIDANAFPQDRLPGGLVP